MSLKSEFKSLYLSVRQCITVLESKFTGQKINLCINCLLIYFLVWWTDMSFYWDLQQNSLCCCVYSLVFWCIFLKGVTEWESLLNSREHFADELEKTQPSFYCPLLNMPQSGKFKQALLAWLWCSISKIQKWPLKKILWLSVYPVRNNCRGTTQASNQSINVDVS